MGFPITRMRRTRRSAGLRAMVRETRVSIKNLVMPLFVVPGKGVRKEIPSLQGLFHLSPDSVVREAEQIVKAGIPAVLLFGIPENKDAEGSSASRADGVVQQSIRALKKEFPELVVITDLCFCEYTSHGHCGIVKGNEVCNDETLKISATQTISHAEAGADIIAPSGMMDGIVQALRLALDEAGFIDTAIMSYSAKFASAFYGPFREAVQSTPQFGDRRSYQMDPPNINEALREVALDIEEGADIVMVKPAIAYLDVIRAVRDRFGVPTAAYQVSGEYAMVKAAAAKGWIDGERIMCETLTAIKRAGADIIISYFAQEFAARLKRGDCE